MELSSKINHGYKGSTVEIKRAGLKSRNTERSKGWCKCVAIFGGVMVAIFITAVVLSWWLWIRPGM